MQNIRELWETTEEIREILESQLRIGEIAQTREESQHTFTALIELELTLLLSGFNRIQLRQGGNAFLGKDLIGKIKGKAGL